MSKDQDRTPLSTEIAPPESEVDPHPSGCWTSGLEVPRLHKSADAAADDRLTPGQMLSGRYRIERELGEGGMGVVYLVSDQQVVGETFAVKVLKEALDPQVLQLLREEVRQTRKLTHPNIVDMHSVNVDGKRLYVLMECLEGKTLNTLLDEEFGRGMPFSHAWPIIEDVGAALGYAHDHNVIHSDLKPANVLLTTSGKTKLLDFGIARVSRGPLLHRRSGSRALTPAYASYEMLKGQEADRRDDIYSFACVIYEILSGDRPYGELNALEARDVGTRVPPLAVLSQAQNEALAQALTFDRAARTASVEQLLAGLVTDRAPGARRNAVQDSVVVLPFINMSSEPENEYFADGISEEIINALAQIRELHVVARSSAFSFKGKHIDPRIVGEQLNVRTVLEGSVRRVDNRLRITAQLINASDGYHLWSERYDREMKDIFEIQDDIARGIAERLKMTLEGGEQRPLIKAGTQNLEAYQLYLKGRVLLPRRGPTAQYLDCFARAVQLDPDYAQALAGLADSYSVLGYTGVVPPGPAMAKALDAARRAVALDGSLAEAHNALAIASLMGAWDSATAEREFRRALTLNPRYIQARVWYALYCLMYSEGRMSEAMAEANLALESDPLSGYAHLMYALICAYAGEYPTAIKASRRSVELDPESYLARMILAEVLRVGGEFEESVATGELALAMSGRHAWAQVSLAYTFADWGKPEHAQAIYAELLGRSRRQYVSPAALAVVAFAASKDDEAVQLARQAVEMRDPHCQFWFSRYGQAADRLYTHPRFREVIALMGRDDWLQDQEPMSRQP